MDNGNDGSNLQPFRLGFRSLRMNMETVNQMLRYLDVACESICIDCIDEQSLFGLDTVVFLNPTLQEQEWHEVLQYLESGGTALVWLSPITTAHTAAATILEGLGLRMGYTRPVSKLKVKYGPKYPVPHKRINGDLVTTEKRSRFIIFKSIRMVERHVPLMFTTGLFSARCITVQVNCGRGAIVFMNSLILPDDRADIAAHLLKWGSSHKPKPEARQPLLEPAEVIEAINMLFEVYDEIPLDVIARDVNAPARGIDRLQLLEVVEQCIRSGDLIAKLRGDVIVKRW